MRETVGPFHEDSGTSDTTDRSGELRRNAYAHFRIFTSDRCGRPSDANIIRTSEDSLPSD